jgi:hypothetical protein
MIMGIDWYPCRVEPGVNREEIDRLVEVESFCYWTGHGGVYRDLQPFVTLRESDIAAMEAEYRKLGRLKDRLLFKMTSHRVTIVSGNEVFPLEWRLRAFGTFLPWALPNQVERWESYRQEVLNGEHRAYLQELMIYLEFSDLKVFFQESLRSLAKIALKCKDSWATRPELGNVRDKILAEPCPTVPPPPLWPDRAGLPLARSALDDERFQALRSSHHRLTELAQEWNSVVRRGNRRCQLPKPLLSLEEWIAKWQPSEGFSSFLVWLQPWLKGGYGLYRDCE